MIAFLRYCLFIFIIIITVVTIFPFTLLRPFNPRNSRILLSYFRFLVETFLYMKIYIEGEENLQKAHPAIIIGNHQHNYDAYTVSKIFAKLNIVVLGKFELGLIPVFGWVYVLCGNLLIRRGKGKKAVKSMENLEYKIKKDKLSILIFPEGHRNPTDTLLPFKKGAFHTAIKTGYPIVPFSISQYLKLNNFNGLQKIKVYVKVHSPIPTQGLERKDLPELIQKSRKVIEDGIQEMNKKHLALNKSNQD